MRPHAFADLHPKQCGLEIKARGSGRAADMVHALQGEPGNDVCRRDAAGAGLGDKVHVYKSKAGFGMDKTPLLS